MSDYESRTAKPNLARGLADDLAGFVSDDPQVDSSARPIWQPQFATQDPGEHLSRLCDLGTDISHLEVKPPEPEPEIAFQQSVADRSDSVVLINHFMQRLFAGRIWASSSLANEVLTLPHITVAAPDRAL